MLGLVKVELLVVTPGELASEVATVCLVGVDLGGIRQFVEHFEQALAEWWECQHFEH